MRVRHCLPQALGLQQGAPAAAWLAPPGSMPVQAGAGPAGALGAAQPAAAPGQDAAQGDVDDGGGVAMQVQQQEGEAGAAGGMDRERAAAAAREQSPVAQRGSEAAALDLLAGAVAAVEEWSPV